MGECVDLQLLRRGRRIIRNYLRQGQAEAHLDRDGLPEPLAVAETVDWCSRWLERRTGHGPTDYERQLLGYFLEKQLRQHARVQAKG